MDGSLDRTSVFYFLGNFLLPAKLPCVISLCTASPGYTEVPLLVSPPQPPSSLRAAQRWLQATPVCPQTLGNTLSLQ